MDNVVNTEDLVACYCGSNNIRELKPYGIESVQCGDCHVSPEKAGLEPGDEASP